MAVTVRRTDISVEENLAEEVSLTSAIKKWSWDAILDGELSSGESVSMSRWGRTADEALTKLENAIKEQGWEII